MKKLKMQLFGSFRLENGTSVVSEEKLYSNKLTCLLVYLLINRDHMLTHSHLIETFWEKDSKNPENALKVQMHRIRSELKALGDEKFILTLPGAYRWNPEVEIESDYERFEEMASEIRKTDDPDKKEKLCREIISCFRGNVSAKVADAPWILPKVTWYQSVYMDSAKKLCSILEGQGKWEEIELICNQALHVDTLDEEIHCFLIKSLQKQKKYDLALSHYEKANKLLYEQMGIQCPKKLQTVFQEMISETNENMTDIGRLIEEAAEQTAPGRVFFCDYQIFRQIYRMELRRVDRLGIAEYIVLFTLKRSGSIWSGISVDHGMIEGMELLEQSIGQSLRVGDVASKYSPTQIVVLLPTCTCENGVKVAERVRRSFRSRIGSRKLELTYEMAELSPTR